MITAETLEIGTVVLDPKTGFTFTIDRLPTKKLRSFGAHRPDGSNVFIYRNELKSLVLA